MYATLLCEQENKTFLEYSIAICGYYKQIQLILAKKNNKSISQRDKMISLFTFLPNTKYDGKLIEKMKNTQYNSKYLRKRYQSSKQGLLFG